MPAEFAECRGNRKKKSWKVYGIPERLPQKAQNHAERKVENRKAKKAKKKYSREIRRTSQKYKKCIRKVKRTSEKNPAEPAESR